MQEEYNPCDRAAGAASGARRARLHRAVVDHDRVDASRARARESDAHRFRSRWVEDETAMMEERPLGLARTLDGESARSLCDREPLRWSRSESVLAHDRRLLAVGQRHVRVTRVGVAERVEILQDVR